MGPQLLRLGLGGLMCSPGVNEGQACAVMEVHSVVLASMTTVTPGANFASMFWVHIWVHISSQTSKTNIAFGEKCDDISGGGSGLGRWDKSACGGFLCS